MTAAMTCAAPAGRRAAGMLAACAASWLAACAPLAPAPTTLAMRQVAPAFELAGRISASDGERAANGRIEWQHDPAADTWTVFSPLGQIAARLQRDAGGATLMTADGQRAVAASAEELLPRVLGVDVPVARLSRWVQAAPEAAAEVRALDALGRPAVVIDQGWRIDYASYADTAPDAPPARIDISRGDARIRLIIDQWTPLP